jgi:hypothetical protein
MSRGMERGAGDGDVLMGVLTLVGGSWLRSSWIDSCTDMLDIAGDEGGLGEVGGLSSVGRFAGGGLGEPL